jgi:hypothetical protein
VVDEGRIVGTYGSSNQLGSVVLLLDVASLDLTIELLKRPRNEIRDLQGTNQRYPRVQVRGGTHIVVLEIQRPRSDGSGRSSGGGRCSSSGFRSLRSLDLGNLSLDLGLDSGGLLALLALGLLALLLWRRQRQSSTTRAETETYSTGDEASGLVLVELTSSEIGRIDIVVEGAGDEIEGGGLIIEVTGHKVGALGTMRQ